MIADVQATAGSANASDSEAIMRDQLVKLSAEVCLTCCLQSIHLLEPVLWKYSIISLRVVPENVVRRWQLRQAEQGEQRKS